MAKTSDQERLKKMSRQILQRWSSYFREVYGHALPRDYLCLDCETSGLDRHRDLPLEIGHCIVRDCAVVHQGSSVLDWTADRNIDRRWLRGRMHETRRSMDAYDKGYRFDLDLLAAEGKNPRKVLAFYRKLFTVNREAGAFFVGQNSWFFDCELLEGCFAQFLRKPFHFGENEVFDCGTMEKGCLLGELPYRQESLRDYFLRVRGIRAAGVRWNMAACLERHSLIEKYGLDMSQAHNAGWDAHACHLLFEEHR